MYFKKFGQNPCLCVADPRVARGENETKKYVLPKFLIRHPTAKVYKGRNYIYKKSKFFSY